MPGGTTVQRGNLQFETLIYLPAVTVPNINANTTQTQTVTVNGVAVGDFISWNQLSSVSGISVENIYVSAANTLTFLWSNTTTSNVTGTAAQPFLIIVSRSDIVPYTALPSVVQ